VQLFLDGMQVVGVVEGVDVRAIVVHRIISLPPFPTSTWTTLKTEISEYEIRN
jgi:hypothetical protein